MLRQGGKVRPGDGSQSSAEFLAVLVPHSVLPRPVLHGDTVTVYKRKGDAAPQTFLVKSITTQEGGLWQLRLN